jgi:hypothetical protein
MVLRRGRRERHTYYSFGDRRGVDDVMPPQWSAYLSGVFTAGIGFVGSGTNGRGRGNATATWIFRASRMFMPSAWSAIARSVMMWLPTTTKVSLCHKPVRSLLLGQDMA